MVPRFARSLSTLAVTLLALVTLPGSASSQGAPISTDHLRTFEPRQIGPAVTGGRITDVESLASDPSLIYVATASGGLWKSENRGHTWTNLFDDMPVSTFGDVALAPSNPEIVYAGTGEQNNRQSTSWGNGVYRSDDGGRTWRHLGLEESRHVGKIEVHPTNPDVAYVAALGNLWAPSEERGIFRTTDGGDTWEKVLHVDEYTGAVDLVMNTSNPDILYAATYQRLRRTWGFNGGGPGSGIHRTIDGGDTWEELTNGIPDGDKGRIGLAISQSNPNVLNALIEYGQAPGGGRGGGFGGGGQPTDTGTYRTTDGGDSWEKVSDQNIRPMYYSEIFIDPTDENVVYTAATSSFKSLDGGRNWINISARPTYDVGVHADKHALWINPNDGDHFYLAGDAGLHETYDGGVNYRKINNFPIGQFYAIGVDMRDPYWVYGGMQDNHSWMGPSESRHWIGILNDDWKQTGFGDGMFQQLDWETSRYAYISSNGGNYSRVDTETGDALPISPIEGPDDDYRWDWTSPSLVSRHDARTVYVAGNRLFISRDRGESWERTPDLSRQIDRDTLSLMGVPGADITISRNDGTSSFGEATIIAESSFDPEILWVGFDDGNIQVSRDQGITWNEVSSNIPGGMGGTYVSRVYTSTRGPGSAYVTLDAHRDGDFAPYVYRTDDFGESFTEITGDLPTGSVNALVEHPDNSDVLFVGTEHHVFVSTNGGGSWAELPNMPTTSIDDLILHPRDKDLVIGTHGNSILILDDTQPLAEWTSDVAAAPAHLFSIPRGTLKNYWKDTSYRGQAEFHGVNPIDGSWITYHLGSGSGPATLTIVNERGQTVREMSVPSISGMHRVSWDLQWGFGETAWSPLDTSVLPRTSGQRGLFVSPGTYTVTLEARGTTSTQTMTVRGDPEMDITDGQYRARENLMLEVQELRTRIQDAGLSQQDLFAMNRLLQGVSRGLFGSGFRGGSFQAPTPAQLEALAEAKAEIEARLSGGR